MDQTTAKDYLLRDVARAHLRSCGATPERCLFCDAATSLLYEGS